MKKMFVLLIVLMVISAPLFAANVLTNGNFQSGTLGWSIWKQTSTAPTFTTDATGGLTHGIRYNGGIFQTFPTVPGQSYTVTGNMASWQYQANYMWAEVTIILNGSAPANGSDVNPTGPGLHSGLWGVCKEDSWNRTAAWNEAFSATHVWTPIQATFVATGSTATIVLKSGNGQSNNNDTGILWSNVAVNGPVVPEPSSMLALASGLFGMAGFAIRRKR